ncbi:MAG TPA: Nif3-like dinuclear metal center hexameric protein [Chthoniobacterales bacterium]|jgi:dinuclear metal center YbgI/SA1388 family protein|nr:Nif3-like dinuclear metal center hexameric protein [Chthoniobacterales bacterium]
MPRVASLTQIVSYADEHLRIREIADWENALNGLQVENSGAVTKIGAAVDASMRTIELAIENGVNLLIVHHGLFWPGLQPISGGRRRMFEQIFRNDLAIYSAHLPLDVHSVLGNNAQLAASLGFENTEPFFEAKGQLVGLRAETKMSREELAAKLEKSLGGPVKMFAWGPAETKSIGLVTGGAGSEIYAVARDGIDTFITGEAPHWAAVAAQELGLNLLLGGHYATETFGVKAFAAHLSERFDLPWEFIDSPTGL